MLNCNFEGRRINALSTRNAQTHNDMMKTSSTTAWSCHENKPQLPVWAKPLTKATNTIAWQAVLAQLLLYLICRDKRRKSNENRSAMLTHTDKNINAMQKSRKRNGHITLLDVDTQLSVFNWELCNDHDLTYACGKNSMHIVKIHISRIKFSTIHWMPISSLSLSVLKTFVQCIIQETSEKFTRNLHRSSSA